MVSIQVCRNPQPRCFLYELTFLLLSAKQNLFNEICMANNNNNNNQLIQGNCHMLSYVEVIGNERVKLEE